MAQLHQLRGTQGILAAVRGQSRGRGQDVCSRSAHAQTRLPAGSVAAAICSRGPFYGGRRLSLHGARVGTGSRGRAPALARTRALSREYWTSPARGGGTRVGAVRFVETCNPVRIRRAAELLMWSRRNHQRLQELPV